MNTMLSISIAELPIAESDTPRLERAEHPNIPASSVSPKQTPVSPSSASYTAQ